MRFFSKSTQRFLTLALASLFLGCFVTESVPGNLLLQARSRYLVDWQGCNQVESFRLHVPQYTPFDSLALCVSTSLDSACGHFFPNFLQSVQDTFRLDFLLGGGPYLVSAVTYSGKHANRETLILEGSQLNHHLVFPESLSIHYGAKTLSYGYNPLRGEFVSQVFKDSQIILESYSKWMLFRAGQDIDSLVFHGKMPSDSVIMSKYMRPSGNLNGSIDTLEMGPDRISLPISQRRSYQIGFLSRKDTECGRIEVDSDTGKHLTFSHRGKTIYVPPEKEAPVRACYSTTEKEICTDIGLAEEIFSH